jgi:DNA polymerase-3 subunit epsilon
MHVQGSFEDLGLPLSEVTFCVLDLETTGGSPAASAITEIGAVKVKCGEVVGTFQTLVNPGCGIPVFIQLLTGIAESLVADAPSIEGVLPNFLEFARGTVLVAHNARFDIGFLNAALKRADYPKLDHRVVDTAGLARKVLAGEVPNNRLETLARHLRCAHRPCHRAYEDVLATVDVLHHLIERVAGFGITTLEDLLRISASRLDRTFHKIALTDDVPTGPGVYRFIAADGTTLYVGKATDLRSRVRSYFYGDPRRKIRDLLRETQRIDSQSYPTTLEAEIAEARAIAAERPPFNRAGKVRGDWFVKIATTGKSPKISTTRVPSGDALHIGPFRAMKSARAFIDAVRDAARIHHCTDPRRCHGCSFGDLGSCAGGDPELQRAELVRVVSAATSDPDELLGRLVAKMARVAAQDRYEEACDVRDRGALLQRELMRHIEEAAWARSGKLVLEVAGRRLEFVNGRMSGTDIGRNGIGRNGIEGVRLFGEEEDRRTDPRVLSSWLRRHGDDARILESDGLALPAALGLPQRFRPREDK